MADISFPTMNIYVKGKKDYYVADTPEYPQYSGEGFTPDDAIDDLLDQLPDVTEH